MIGLKSLSFLTKYRQQIKNLKASTEVPCVNITTKTRPEFCHQRSRELCVVHNLATPSYYRFLPLHKHKMATYNFSVSDCTRTQWNTQNPTKSRQYIALFIMALNPTLIYSNSLWTPVSHKDIQTVSSSLPVYRKTCEWMDQFQS